MAKNLYAVIIGINAYPFNPLNGCIGDAMAVSKYFQDLCAAQGGGGLQWKPQYLLAPNSEDMRTVKALSNTTFAQPKRDNIIAAFDHFKQAKDGDFCLLYYSGHGSTAPVPDVFMGYTPGNTLQTIVCQDSRINGKPDLLDKELGYLIASVLDGKEPAKDKEGVHFLAFIDCCHSGTITRGVGDGKNTPVSRMAQQGFSPEKIVGFDPNGNCFYTPFKPGQKTVDPNGGLRHARYINLSGARDSESAYEIFFNTPDGKRQKRGVFTWSVLECLQQGGVNISYGELIRRAEMSVRARVDNQIPQLGKTDLDDENLYFLRNALQTPEATYPVQWDKGIWKINAGAINGFVGPDYGKSASIILNDGRVVQITTVKSKYSILDASSFNEADQTNLTLSGKVHKMPLPEVKIGISPQLSAPMKAAVEQAFAAQKPMYAALAKGKKVAQYIISPLLDKNGQNCYALTRPGSSTPLFMRTPSSSQFLSDLAKLTRYEYVLQMSNPLTQLPKNAVKIDIKTLEGVDFNTQTLNSIPASSFKTVMPQSPAIPYPELVRVTGKERADGTIQLPAMQVRITPQAGPCWVGVLYCDAKCVIEPGLMKVQKIGGEGEPPFADLKLTHKGVNYLSIPLNIDKNWQDNGVSEIQDHLIVFVSTQSFDLDKYKQEGIKLDITRSVGFGDEEEAVEKDDWFTIKIPIQIAIPKSKQALAAGGSKSFGAFQVTAPAGFAATAEAITRSSLVQGRGGADMLPPASLWDGVEGRPEVFARGVSAAPDTHLSMLELTNVSGVVNTQNPLVLTPSDPLAADESILPFAYDAENDIYYPIGYTDAEGRVRIEQLPSSTPGTIGQAGEGQRSVGSSLKLFFQKLVWSKITGRQNYNRLSLLHAIDQKTTYTGGKSKLENAALAEIKAAVKKGNTLLMIHGIIGDQEGAAPFIFGHPAIPAHYSAVLTFEYENLDTKIQETAAKLLSLLKKCDVPKGSVTIIAHSTGGLVSRYMIEKLDGAPLVKQLIQMGTPNGGSEIADFRKKLFGWITLGINGITKLKPYLSFCSMLWKGLDNSIFRTLDQMQPGSDFLKELNSGDGSKRKVPYTLIAGNTSIIESSAGDDETVYKQVITGLKERGKYILADFALFENEINDMAVRVDSMKEVPGGFVEIKEIACDHLSYYEHHVVPPVLVPMP
jgi:pimeloyl-ACP methyl ester carboxylesterase